MADTTKTKEMIIEFLQTNGPSLPIQISKHVKMDSLFASAFLSELLRENKVKLSHMKVGTSPVYILPGTEEGMEKYIEYLKGKEREALALLKEKRFLEDVTQHPAHRVALREVKDFAIPFKLNDKVIWRYFTIPAQEYLKAKPEAGSQKLEAKQEPKMKNQEPEVRSQMPETKQEEPKTSLPKSFVSSVQQTMSDNEEKEKSKEETKPEPTSSTDNSTMPLGDAEGELSSTEGENLLKVPIKHNSSSDLEKLSRSSNRTEIKENKTSQAKPLNPIMPQKSSPALQLSSSPAQKPSGFLNPLAAQIQQQTKEETPKPEFCQKIIEIIKKNNWQIIEEIEAKKKEYNALIQINSDLGPIIFKLQAKDKKTVGEADMSKLLGEAQAIPLPALYMTHGEVKKKAQDFLDKYISVMKYKQIE
jgi:hypothetical protein